MDAFTSETAPELQTKRLILRPIEAQDSQAFLAIFSDPETMRYWSGEPISQPAEADALLARDLEWSRSETCINWGVALASSNRLIGKFTLFRFSEQNRRAEVGYVLNRQYWGKGYMSEAMARILEFSFADLNLYRLEADTDPGNAASLALLEKYGFKQEGFFRERWYIRGQWMDSVMFGLLKDDYLNG